MCSDVLELLQGGVGLEGVRDVLCRLSIELVEGHTASESQKETSGGADGRERVCGDVLELLQGGVGREGVREVLCRLSIKPVGVQTASKSQKETSGGADALVQKRAQTEMQARGGGQCE